MELPLAAVLEIGVTAVIKAALTVRHCTAVRGVGGFSEASRRFFRPKLLLRATVPAALLLTYNYPAAR